MKTLHSQPASQPTSQPALCIYTPLLQLLQHVPPGSMCRGAGLAPFTIDATTFCLTQLSMQAAPWLNGSDAVRWLCCSPAAAAQEKVQSDAALLHAAVPATHACIRFASCMAAPVAAKVRSPFVASATTARGSCRQPGHTHGQQERTEKQQHVGRCAVNQGMPCTVPVPHAR